MPGKELRKPRILLGGVPFGRDNVGDEAIIECVVNIVRELRPDADIWVSTDDQQGTAKKLNVNTHPLFGFVPPGFDREEMRQAVRDCDTFIWSGATGLSDYPDIPLEMLEYAVQQKKQAIIFCTGMNDQLNPSLYHLLPGKRRLIFDTIKAMTLGAVDLSHAFESKRTSKTHETMRQVIPQASLVILRDAESHNEISKVIGTEAPVQIGADPAITLTCPDIHTCSFEEQTLRFLETTDPKIGLCISAQSPVKQLSSMQTMFDALTAARKVKIVGIPMNPITDAELLETFRDGLENPESMHVIQGRYEPEEITAVASQVDVVISSRLHLLILASITLTPFIGISRGTKVTNFTRQFDLPDIGSVETLDMGKLSDEIERLLDNRPDFRNKAEMVRFTMSERLSRAKGLLREILNPSP
jgi:polysaccharide pyruvyl transferase WcaK-like protein